MDELLASVEGLSHRQRMRRMVDLGRSPEARPAIDALAAGTPYERGLALATVFGSRDGARAVQALTDPSRTLRRRGVRLAAWLATDDQLLNAFPALTDPTIGGRLVRELRRRRRVALVDRLLATLDGPLADDLAPLGSPAFIGPKLDRLFVAGSLVTWIRLAVRHPTLVRDHVVEQVTTAARSDLRLGWRVNAVLPALVGADPDAALAVVGALLDAGEDPSGWALRRVVVRLARIRPVATFDVLRRRHGATPILPAPAFAGVRFDRVVRRLGAERLQWLVTHAWWALGDGHAGHVWLRSLDEPDRAVVLAAWLARGAGSWGGFLLGYAPAGPAREQAWLRWSHAARSLEGLIADTALDALPADLRHREARRHLAEVEALATEPLRRLAYARLLPFAEARTVIAPFLGHPEGEVRGPALRALIGTIRHERRSTGEALGVVLHRRFEQDPVRFAMIDALAALPERCFDSTHLTDLATIVGHAVDAADLSAMTAAAVERLIVGRLRVDAPWVGERLGQVLAVRGTLTAPFLSLRPTEATALAPALTAMAERWTTRERVFAVLWLARGLGPQLRRVPGILDTLERLAVEQPFVHSAAVALALLRPADPARFAAMVPRLVTLDPSFVIVPSVARHLAVVATDRLGPFLQQGPMSGRFATGRTRWVVDFGDGQGGWTEAQHRAHAEAWCGVLEDDQVDVRTSRQAVMALLRLGFADPAPVLRAASDRRPPVREIAIRGLPHLDGGQGVPVLLECLGDDRARYAIYALRAAFRELTPSAVLGHLRAAPLGKVTVAKEVVRLLGELGDEAWPDLLALDRGDLHRDVRIALLRALWDHLDREETWAIFERAATGADWVVASRLGDVPPGRLSREAERRLTRLVVTLFGRPEPEARLDLLRRAATLPLSDPDRALIDGLLGVVSAGKIAEAELAWDAVRARLWPGDVARVSALFTAKAANRRWLSAIVAVTERWLGPYLSGAQNDLVVRMLAVLAEDPGAVVPYLRLGMRTLEGGPVADALIAASRKGVLHADAVATAVQTMPSTAHPWVIEGRLRAEADPQLRRIAVRALEIAASPERGWTVERRALLARYRTDGALLVSSAAAFVFPPDEG